ncbi:hypothetical protein BB558_001128 [Smittium angustum]|uniref:Reverse transcriptase/retrotransposon-derived protein RNase H-like domain-containing protein n=1 Tax=Smittium angustum TaxID=133377 RepID=A0A2U1JCK6_SMIAN|nr:hypothetical protein BB558_001128 [Smittium angustum]
MLEPIFALLKKDAKLLWTQECTLAFKKLIKCLMTEPLLKQPTWDQSFVLSTDASSFAIVFTDSSAVAIILRDKNPTGCTARWIMRLREYSVSIKHRKGKENVVAIFLPRDGAPINFALAANKLPIISKTTFEVVEKLLQNHKSNEATVKNKLVRNFILFDDKLFRKLKNGQVIPVVKTLQELHTILDKLHNQMGYLGFESIWSWSKVSGIFDKWSIDFLGPFPLSSQGKRYLLNAIDILSDFSYSEALPNTTSTSPEWLEKIERLNGSIRYALTKTAHNDILNWDTYQSEILHGIQNQTQVQTGYSSFELMFVVKLRLPVDFLPK